MEEIDGNFVLTTVLPVSFRDREVWLLATLVEIRWDIHLNTELLRILGSTVRIVRFWIATRNEDTSIVKKLYTCVRDKCYPSQCNALTVASEWYKRATMVLFRMEMR